MKINALLMTATDTLPLKVVWAVVVLQWKIFLSVLVTFLVVIFRDLVDLEDLGALEAVKHSLM